MKYNFIGQRRIQIPADKSLSSYFVDFPFAALHIFWSFMFLSPSTILLSFFCDYCSQKRLILLRLFSKIAPQFATFCTLCIKIASYRWRVIFNHFVCTVITQVTRTRNVTIGWNHKRSVDLVISCERQNCKLSQISWVCANYRAHKITISWRDWFLFIKMFPCPVLESLLLAHETTSQTPHLLRFLIYPTRQQINFPAFLLFSRHQNVLQRH